MNKLKAFLLFLVLNFGISYSALAQVLPPSTDASVLSTRVSEEAERKVTSIAKEIDIEEKERKTAAPSGKDKKFFVKEIQLDGNKLLTKKKLNPIIAPYEGRDILLSEAKELAKEIEKAYRDEGYIMTYAYLPPQKIKDQKLKIAVLEGKTGKVIIEGNKWFSKKNLMRYSQMKEGKPLKYEVLAKSVQRMNDNPDRDVKAILQPGDETGETDIYLKVKDRFPLHVGGSFDNQGTESTGRRRFGANFRHNNFIFPDALLLSGAFLGKDFGSVYGQYLIPITPFGTKLALGFSHSRISPKKEFKIFDIDGRSQNYTATISQPIVERERFSINSHLGFELKESVTHNVAGTSRRDRLRVLRPGFDIRLDDRLGSTVLSNEVSFGIDGFGATSVNNPLSSKRGAPPNFVSLTGSLYRSLRLPFNTFGTARFDYQLSLDKLTPQEEQYLGGLNTIRGYPEGDFLADQGFTLRLEYFVPPFFVPDNWQIPYMNKPLKEQFQLLFFSDLGYGRLRGVRDGQTRSRYLHGIGAGVRIFLIKNLSARIELAHAIGNEPLTESNHTRVHFSLNADI